MIYIDNILEIDSSVLIYEQPSNDVNIKVFINIYFEISVSVLFEFFWT